MRVEREALDADTTLLTVHGELVGTTGRRLLADAEPLTADVIVDLTETAFFDSGGVAAVIAVWEAVRRAEGRFVLVVPPATQARRTLETRGLASALPLMETRTAAVKSLARSA